MSSAILCPVCGTWNHHLAVTCSSCGGFVQGRIENLDLFSTVWSVLERPQRAFHIIAIARHKNYSLLLSALAGIALTFFVFWSARIGDHTSAILNVLAAGFAIGPLFGLLSVLLISAIITALGSVTGVRINFRNSFAVCSYALVPVVFALIFILPIELMTFGVYFFASNPSPFILRPTSYVLLIGLNGIFTVWSVILLIVGVGKLSDVGWLRAIALGLLPLILYIGLLGGVLRLILMDGL